MFHSRAHLHPQRWLLSGASKVPGSARTETTTHLNQSLVFQGDLAIVADLPEGGAEAPLIGGNAKVLGVLHTLGCDPWDPLYALWKTQFLESPGSTVIPARSE